MRSFFAIELPTPEASAAIAGAIFPNIRAPERILRRLTSNLLKRIAELELTRNRVFDDEYRSAELAAAG
jgi:hypothetical protein